MRPSRTLIQVIVLVVGGVYFAAYLVKGLPTSDLLQPLGAASAFAALAVLAFDHCLWRMPKIGFRLSGRPDIRGTWKGTLISQWVDPETGRKRPPFEVYLVIRQTFWSINATLITEESKSRTEMASLRGGSEGPSQLLGIYHNKPRAEVRHRSPIHFGSFSLDVATSPTRSLDGHYWTDRNTIGDMEFASHSRETVSTFGEAQRLTFLS